MECVFGDKDGIIIFRHSSSETAAVLGPLDFGRENFLTEICGTSEDTPVAE